MNTREEMRMSYEQGVSEMIRLASEEPSGRRYVNSFFPHANIRIDWPGKKAARGDYRVSLVGDSILSNAEPTHGDIALKLYDLVKSGEFSSTEMLRFLINVYENGTLHPYNDPVLRELQYILFWVTMQEKINYPRGKGIRLPFARYYEAIRANENDFELTIDEVWERCNNHGRGVPTLIRVQNPPCFYK